MSSSGDDLVTYHGEVFVRVWHGARVHPVSGVKGGMMLYPHRETDPREAPPDDAPQPEPRRVVRREESYVCARCGTEKRVRNRSAGRHRYCSRSCAMKARHAERRAAVARLTSTRIGPP